MIPLGETGRMAFFPFFVPPCYIYTTLSHTIPRRITLIPALCMPVLRYGIYYATKHVFMSIYHLPT